MPRNAATQNNNTENMEQHVPFKVTITEHNPERGVLANADVNVAGIMISASHNPYYDNGIKLIDCYGEKMPEETLLLVED